jgi:hypothetical protein
MGAPGRNCTGTTTSSSGRRLRLCDHESLDRPGAARLRIDRALFSPESPRRCGCGQLLSLALAPVLVAQLGLKAGRKVKVGVFGRSTGLDRLAALGASTC